MTKAAELAKMGDVLTNSQIGGRRNIVINGAMNVSQRSTSVTGLGDGDEGYVKGNVVITTRFVNLGRNRDNDEVRFRDFLDEMFGKPVKIEKYI